ncbi:MAG: hypothetical protein ACYTEQ_26195 [Planctomycetota bacterium]|jgi:hypothetical protein
MDSKWDAIRARVEKYEDTRGYDVLDYPARVAGIEASKQLKANASDDIRALLDAVDERDARIEALEGALNEHGPIDTRLMDIWDTAHSAAVVNRDMRDPTQIHSLLVRIGDAAQKARKIAREALGGE